jgi:hypothetical protein
MVRAINESFYDMEPRNFVPGFIGDLRTSFRFYLEKADVVEQMDGTKFPTVSKREFHCCFILRLPMIVAMARNTRSVRVREEINRPKIYNSFRSSLSCPCGRSSVRERLS